MNHFFSTVARLGSSSWHLGVPHGREEELLLPYRLTWARVLSFRTLSTAVQDKFSDKIKAMFQLPSLRAACILVRRGLFQECLPLPTLAMTVIGGNNFKKNQNTWMTSMACAICLSFWTTFGWCMPEGRQTAYTTLI